MSESPINGYGDNLTVFGTRIGDLSPDEHEKIEKKLSIMGADLLVENLKKLEEGNLKFIEQAHSEATYAKKIDKGETILGAANRELQEEIGYMSSNLEHVHTLDLAPGYIDHKTHIVVARDLQKSSLKGDEPEPLKIIQHSIDEIKKSYCLTNYSHVDSRVYSSLYVFFNSQNNK